jgi:hypothetical protein
MGSTSEITALEGTRALIGCLKKCRDVCAEGLASREGQVALGALHDIVAKEDAPMEARSEAAMALFPQWGEHIEKLLFDISRRPDTKLAAAAALSLVRGAFPKYREHIAALLKAWGPLAPYPANEVGRIYQLQANKLNP